MNEKNLIKMNGVNVSGVERVYGFPAVSAEAGLEIFHKTDFATLMTGAAEVIALLQPSDDELKEAEKTGKEWKPDGAGVLLTVKMISGLMDWDTATWLFKEYLAGGFVKVGENKTTIGEDGHIRLGKPDPAEQYTALCYSLFANHPEYADFFAAEVVSDSDRQSDETTDDPQS
jgi:hypothetical protein